MSGQERKPPYSIRDVPRLHSKNLAGKRPEVHWAGARVMVDAVEAEFARQAKPKLGDASDAKDKSPPGGGAEEKDKPGSSRDRAPPNDSAEPDTETPVYAKEAERIRALYRQLNVSLNPPNYPMTDVADLDTETPDKWGESSVACFSCN